MNTENDNVDVLTITTKVSKNQPGSKSLRMQIPSSMREFMGIEDGDELEIELVLEADKRIAKIVKR